MISAAFIETMLTNVKTNAPRWIDYSERGQVVLRAKRINAEWSDWSKIEPLLVDRTPICEIHGARIWHLLPGVLVSEMGKLFKPSISMHQARTYALDLANSRNLRNMKEKTK